MAQILKFVIVCGTCGSPHTHLTDEHGIAIFLKCLDCDNGEFVRLVESDDPRSNIITNPEADPVRDQIIQELDQSAGRTHVA